MTKAVYNEQRNARIINRHGKWIFQTLASGKGHSRGSKDDKGTVLEHYDPWQDMSKACDDKTKLLSRLDNSTSLFRRA